MREVPAIVLAGHGRPPEYTQVQIDEPGPREVCVRMVAGGICHTDLAAVRDARSCPVLLGHEGAGIVEAAYIPFKGPATVAIVIALTS